jgi:hypothetical protein
LLCGKTINHRHHHIKNNHIRKLYAKYLKPLVACYKNFKIVLKLYSRAITIFGSSSTIKIFFIFNYFLLYYNWVCKMKVAPSVTLFSHQMLPLWCSIICLQMANPNPLPTGFLIFWFLDW